MLWMLIAMARKYKYMKKDFMDLDVSLRHLTIYLNFIGDRVEATNTLEITANKNLKELVLDADRAAHRFPRPLGHGASAPSAPACAVQCPPEVRRTARLAALRFARAPGSLFGSASA